MKKQKVLIFIDWYLPGVNAGGPVRTCANMVDRLKEVFEFRIITRNTDLKGTTPYPGILSNEWNKRDDGSYVYYFSMDRLNYKNIKKLILEEKPHAIHFNSMYSFYFTMLPLIALRNLRLPARLVLGPRGMLSKGALEIKPFKKKLFLFVAKTMGLFKNLTWHASTEIEKKEIIEVFGPDVKIQLAIDLAPAASATLPVKTKKVNEADFFYLGRISPVKNLLQCIKVLSCVKDPYLLNFHIFGPVEDPVYWETCQAEIKKCGNNIKTEYRGPVNHEELTGLLSHFHFLLLLTENENYGHAIIESMSLGCPVIISNRTPWRNLENMKAGWDMDLNDIPTIINRIQSATAMDQSSYDSWSEGAFNMAQRVINNEKSVEDNKALFS